MKLWRGLAGAVAVGGLMMGIQMSMNALLAFELPGIPPLVPDARIRILLAVFAFLAGLIASYRPEIPSEACSLWRCAFRALLWAILLSGFWLEMSSLLRYSLLPVPFSKNLTGIPWVAGFIWLMAFGLLSEHALQIRRQLNPARS